MLYVSPADRHFIAESYSRFFIAIIFIVLIFYLCIETRAQSEIKISGRVTDLVSGAPIPGATVAIDGTGRISTTDSDGRFYFTDLPTGKYTVTAKRIRFRQGGSEAVIDDVFTSSITISLARSPVIVRGQAVTKTRDDLFVVNRLGAVTVVDIPTSGLGSIAQLTDKLPELELVESGNRQYLRIRGAPLNGTVIMLNGRSINSTFDSRGDISTIPFGSVTTVEIVTGGDYKSPGLAGTVNFITDIDRKNIIVAAERGNFGFESYSAGGGFSFAEIVTVSLDTRGEYSKGDFEFVDPRDSVQIRLNNFNKSSSLYAGSKIKWDRSSVMISARYFKRTAGVPGAVFQLTPDALSESEEMELASGFERRFFGNAVFDITAGLNRRRAEFDSPRTSTNFIPYKTRFDEHARDIKIGFNSTGSVDLNGYYSIRYESLDGNDLIRPSSSFGFHSRTINALSLGMGYRFSILNRVIEHSVVTIGLREEWGDEGDFLSPSVSLRMNTNFPLNPGFDISFSKGRRLPDLTDLYWKEDVFATPNPELNPEESESFQAGADLKSDYAGTTELRLTSFFNRYRDLIIWRKWAGDKFKPVNLSKAEIDGWEMTFESIPFSGPLRLFWAASFIRPLNKEEEASHRDKYLTFRPIGTQTMSIEFRQKRFELKLRGRHIGACYTTEENTKSRPAVDLLDLEVKIKLDVRRVRSSLGFGVVNIGDIQYEILDRQPEKPREYRVKITLSSKGE
ncbi:MAG: TonB-dependent receptor [candidate division Zixibacteria bacterium]